jgi:hypothetical protein
VCLAGISIIGSILEKEQNMAEIDGRRGICASVGTAVVTIIGKKVTRCPNSVKYLFRSVPYEL